MITITDFQRSLPLVIIGITSLLILIVEIILPKDPNKKGEEIIFNLSLLALVAAIMFSFSSLDKNILLYGNFIRITTVTTILDITILLGVFITVLSSKNYLEQEEINYGEYYSLLFLSLFGMQIMIFANDLIMLFVGLELMSVCFYVLAGFMRKKMDSNESALKYFLLGAFLTGFLLLGIAFIYGFTGTTNYTVASSLKTGKETFFLLGLVLVFVTFVFKTGSFPLQMWVPDVYQGAPTIVTGMMSSVGKAAAFGAMITFFAVYEFKSIPLIVAIIAVLTMMYGNIVALVQENIKRLLAYSSIAHAGYLMIGFITLTTPSTQAVLFYLIAYILMQLGAFIIIGIVESKHSEEKRNTLESFKGLGRQHPWLASLLTIFLFSLAGIPPFAGFWGKYYIFLSAIQNNYLWVAIVGILLSLVGVYYYIRIILYMWFYESAEQECVTMKSNYSFVAAVISTIGLFAFGIYPELIFRIIRTIS